VAQGGNAGAREGLAAKPKPGRSAERVELEKLRRKTERLEAEMERAKTALEIARKVRPLLEQLSGDADAGCWRWRARTGNAADRAPHPARIKPG
jgi:hypothetical protein